MKGPHDIIADPEFVRPGTDAGANFRPAKVSPAVGSGKPLPQVTTDITGARRAPGAPDRGAYAFAAAKQAAPPTAPTAAPRNDGAKGTGERTEEQEMSPSSDTSGAGTANDTRATGDSEGLARTGAGITAPLAFGAGMLALGGVIVFLIRRKRT